MKKKHVIVLSSVFIIVLFSTFITFTIDIYKGRKITLDLVNFFVNSKEYKLCQDDFEKDKLNILLKTTNPDFLSENGLSKGKDISFYLVKDLYLKNSKKNISYIRKYILAKYVINYTVSKDLQLNLFINLVPFGNNIYGFSNAANFYFNKEFKDLDREEFLALVATIANPEIYNIIDYPIQNKNRIKIIEKII